MKCSYEMADGQCKAPIEKDASSYSGFSHAEGRDWLHWASPVPYSGSETNNVFVPCAICGQKGSDNPQHFTANGHRFVNALVQLS